MLPLETNPTMHAKRAKRMATSDSKMADTADKIFIGKGEQPAWLVAFRSPTGHGLVTGATGNRQDGNVAGDGGRILRAAGVSVFAADIKGDLSGISEAGEAKDFYRQAGDRDGAEL